MHSLTQSDWAIHQVYHQYKTLVQIFNKNRNSLNWKVLIKIVVV